MRILIVEDDQTLNETIGKRLKQKGYGVDSCFDGKSALDYMMSTEYDAVILDVMLPEMDGFTVCKKAREQKKETPILMLTAKDSIEDRVAGLDGGADDYLVKPFAFDELFARLRVMLRNHFSGRNTESRYLSVGNLCMDLKEHVVSADGVIIELTAKEYAILEYMMRNKNICLSRDQLQSHIWNYDFMGGSNIVDVYVSNLRRKLSQRGVSNLIETVRSVGYKLCDKREGTDERDEARRII